MANLALTYLKKKKKKIGLRKYGKGNNQDIPFKH